MAEWQDVYKNIQTPDPLKQIQSIQGVFTADQQLRLLKQAEQIKQYELMQSQASDLLSTVGTLANVNASNAEVRAHLAQRARQLGVNPRVYDLAVKPFEGLEGKALQRALQVHGARAAGVPGITARETIVQPETGAAGSVPATSIIGGGVPTGIGPAATASQAAAGGAAGAAIAQARDNSLRYNEQVFPLEQAHDSLVRLGPQGTGPGADTLNHIKSFLLTAGVPGVDANKITHFDEAKKYLTQYVNTTGDSGTNEKLAAAFAGNPSVSISNQAAVNVVQSAIALRRFSEARLRAFEASGLPDGDFAKFAGRWAREHDVRAYGFDLMTPAQRKKIMDSLPETDKVKKRTLFKLDVQQATENNLIRPPRVMPPGG